MAHGLGQIVVAPVRIDEIGEHADAKVAVGQTVDPHRALGETLIVDRREPSAVLAMQMTGDASPVAVGRMAAPEQADAVGRRANRDFVVRRSRRLPSRAPRSPARRRRKSGLCGEETQMRPPARFAAAPTGLAPIHRNPASRVVIRQPVVYSVN